MRLELKIIPIIRDYFVVWEFGTPEEFCVRTFKGYLNTIDLLDVKNYILKQ